MITFNENIYHCRVLSRRFQDVLYICREAEKLGTICFSLKAPINALQNQKIIEISIFVFTKLSRRTPRILFLCYPLLADIVVLFFLLCIFVFSSSSSSSPMEIVYIYGGTKEQTMSFNENELYTIEPICDIIDYRGREEVEKPT